MVAIKAKDMRVGDIIFDVINNTLFLFVEFNDRPGMTSASVLLLKGSDFINDAYVEHWYLSTNRDQNHYYKA